MVTRGTMRSETPALVDMACTAREHHLPGPLCMHAHMPACTNSHIVFQQLVHNLLNATKLHYCVFRCVRSQNMQLSHAPRLPPPVHTPALGFPFSPPPPACVPLYLLQPIIVPTYGVSSCEPQFRGSEILLSDCHNASASGEPPPPFLLRSPLSPLSTSAHTPPPPASLLTIPDFKCFSC